MKIEVKLFANFRHGRFKVRDCDLPSDTTCLQVVESLEISEKEIGVILVNGRHAALSQNLEEGDVISIFPLVGGG